jgi:DNA polymerase-1
MSDYSQNLQELTRLAVEMRQTGIPVDEEARSRHRTRLQANRKKAKEAFFESIKDLVNTDLAEELQNAENAAADFNLDSSTQIRDLFYNKLGLKPKKAYNSKTTGVPGVPKSALRDAQVEGVGRLRDVATALLSYREENKYETSYVGDGYYLEPDHYGIKLFRQDKRVHFRWNPGAAETLRSTGDGQQVPKPVYDAKGDIKREGLRDLYIAPEGYVMIEADYSQQELRKLSLYAKAVNVIRELTRPGGDAHWYFCKSTFKFPKDLPYDKKLHKTPRDLQKTLTFGVLLYGGAAETGWRQIAPKYPSITVQFVEQAKTLAYKDNPELPQYHKDQIKFAKENGYTDLPGETIKLPWRFGPISGNLVGDPIITEVINKRIQMGCAIMMNRAMVRVRDGLRAIKGQIVLQVHDALFAFVPEDKVDEGTRIIKANMETEETYHGETMSFPVDIKRGTCWGTLAECK